jgi:hypothetical protein
MIDIRIAVATVVTLAVAAAGAAQAQTVTRTIKVEPVETVITQGADGSTVVTRRPLQDAPASMTYTPPPLNSLMNAPADGAATFVPPPLRVVPPAVAQSETTTPPPPPATAPRRATPRTAVRTAAQRPNLAPKRPAGTHTASRARPAAPRVRVARTPARIGAPLRLASAPVVLDAVQRQYIYRTIVEQEVAPQIAPPLTFTDTDAPPVVAETEIVARTVPAFRRPVAYAIGSRLPQAVPLIAVPAAAAEHMRWLARYSYAILNNRVLLVDPDTGVVVADVTQ